MTEPRYRIRVVRSPRRIRQRFHVVVESAANGQTVLTSEQYRDPDYAQALARILAETMNAELVE